MPISLDLGALVASVNVQMQRELKMITGAFAQLGAWLGQRLAAVRPFERQTRGYPELRFVRGALTVAIDASQRGTLAVPDPRSTLQRMGDTFFGPFREIPTMVSTEYREARLLSALTGSLVRMVRAVEEAINRHTPPGPEMFALNQPGRASDIFGAAGMAAWALLGGTTPAGIRSGSGHAQAGGMGQLLQIMSNATTLQSTVAALNPERVTGVFGGVHEQVQQLVEHLGLSDTSAAGSESETDAQEAASVGLPALLDTVVRGLAGTLLILPLLPHLMGPIMAAAQLRVQDMLLRTFRAIEASVIGMRAQVIELVLVRLPRMGEQAYDVLRVVERLAIAYVDAGTRFAELLLETFLTTFEPFLKDLSKFIQRIEQFIRAILDALEAVLDYDLMGALLDAIGYYDWPGWIREMLPEPVPLTIRDVVESAFSAGRSAVQTSLDAFIQGIQNLLGTRAGRWLDEQFGLNLRVRARGLRSTVNILLSDTPAPVLGAPIELRGTDMPDLFAAFFGRSVESLASVGQAMARLQGSAGQVVDAGAEMMAAMSYRFDRFAGQAARMGSVAQYETVAQSAAAASEALYGDQVQQLAERSGSRRQADALAQWFERQVAEGGFTLIQEALPLYIGGMQEYWTGANAPAGRFGRASNLPSYTPTSPHIIDRRVRLRRVEMPRLTLRVPGHALDDALAALLAGHFKTQVEQAYATGLDALPD